MKIVTVLKTGGDFDKEYVDWIRESVPKEYDFVCLSDDPEVPGYFPLDYHYPGWWSKMEIFRPGILDDDIFYLDLDTVILKDITEDLHELESSCCFLMLSDFYNPDRLASGIMYIPRDLRIKVWNSWIDSDPEKMMEKYRGDQDFLENLIHEYTATFDDIFGDDWVCSYKAHIAKSYPKGVEPKVVDVTKSKIICFHGKPRPKDIKDIW